MSLPRDIRVPYPLAVSERKVDREEWSDEVGRLVEQEAAGNKSAFARLVGVSVKTVDRWLAGEVNVSQESVQAVCDALNLPAGPMLVKLGLIREQDIPSSGPAQLVAEDQAAIEMIQGADITPALKRELLAHLRDQQGQHERQRLAEIERMIQLARRTRGRAG